MLWERKTYITGLSTERLLQTLLENAGRQEDPMSLPLEEADRQMLARIIMREEEPLTQDLLEGALQALRHRANIVQREGEIKRGIMEAERRNDVAALLRLKQEKLELDRKMAGME